MYNCQSIISPHSVWTYMLPVTFTCNVIYQILKFFTCIDAYLAQQIEFYTLLTLCILRIVFSTFLCYKSFTRFILVSQLYKLKIHFPLKTTQQSTLECVFVRINATNIAFFVNFDLMKCISAYFVYA